MLKLIFDIKEKKVIPEKENSAYKGMEAPGLDGALRELHGFQYMWNGSGRVLERKTGAGSQITKGAIGRVELELYLKAQRNHYKVLEKNMASDILF